MSSFVRSSVPGDIYSNTIRIWDEDNSDLFVQQYQYSYQQRQGHTNKDNWRGVWPQSKFMGDTSAGVFPLDTFDGFEEIRFSHGGNQTQQFVRGLCIDGVGVTLAAANVTLYLTSTDRVVSAGVTDANGIYNLGSPFVGQNHYAVANYGPNTLVGTTVNTLVPVAAPW